MGIIMVMVILLLYQGLLFLVNIILYQGVLFLVNILILLVTVPYLVTVQCKCLQCMLLCNKCMLLCNKCMLLCHKYRCFSSCSKCNKCNRTHMPRVVYTIGLLL